MDAEQLVTFRRLATEAQSALHATDSGPAEEAMELMIDLACHVDGCFRSDVRLVGLKLIFLIVARAGSLLGLSRREWRWKDAEILCCAISSLWLSASGLALIRV